MFKKIIFGLISVCSVSGMFAAVNLSLDVLVIPGGTGLYQYSSPSVGLEIRNIGSDGVNITSPVPAGFITCKVGGEVVFLSNLLSNLIIDANTKINFPVVLSNLSTKNVGNQSLVCTLGTYTGWTISKNSSSISYTVLERAGGRFDAILDTIRDPIKNKIDGPVAEIGVGGVKSFFYSLIDRFAVRAAVLVGVLFALIALIKIMFSEEEKSLTQVRGLILRGVVGIFVILSAKFIGKLFYTDILANGEVGVGEFNLVRMIGQLYDLILTPIINIAFYIMMAVLFVILLIRVFSFVTSNQEEVQKKSKQIIISTVLGLFIIIGSKQLVEGVYGKELLIRNNAAVTITDVGSSFLSNINIPIIYDIIKRVMGLTGFVILALIIFQTFKMLTNPTDDKSLGEIKNTLLYALLGMIVIGSGYLIVNVLMVN